MLRPALIAPLAIALLAGCSDDGDSGGAGGSAGSGADPCGGAGKTFVAGIEQPGDVGSLVFVIADSNPAPPQVGDNRWTLKLIRYDGAPVTGASVTVLPEMPVHDHPSPKQPAVTDQGDGTYVLDPVNFNMPGLWETTIDATPPGGSLDTAMFPFCIGE